MDKRKVYMINKETISLSSEYDEVGNEFTRVIEGERMFFVAMTPNDIIDRTLKYYGSCREGAILGARTILGEKHSVPVAIGTKEGLVFFPCGSFRRKDSVWLANAHISRLERLGKETIVYTNYGHCLIVPMNISQIDIKMGQASRLQMTLTHRSAKKMLFLYERESDFILRKGNGEFSFTEKDEEK